MAEKIGIFLDIFVHSFRSEYGGRFVDTPNESPGSQLSYAASTNLLRCRSGNLWSIKCEKTKKYPGFLKKRLKETGFCSSIHQFGTEYRRRFVDTANESSGIKLSNAVSTNLLRCSFFPQIFINVPIPEKRTSKSIRQHIRHSLL